MKLKYMFLFLVTFLCAADVKEKCPYRRRLSELVEVAKDYYTRSVVYVTGVKDDVVTKAKDKYKKIKTRYQETQQAKEIKKEDQQDQVLELQQLMDALNAIQSSLTTGNTEKSIDSKETAEEEEKAEEEQKTEKEEL